MNCVLVSQSCYRSRPFFNLPVPQVGVNKLRLLAWQQDGVGTTVSVEVEELVAQGYGDEMKPFICRCVLRSPTFANSSTWPQFVVRSTTFVAPVGPPQVFRV